jgi:hypothetical protein
MGCPYEDHQIDVLTGGRCRYCGSEREERATVAEPRMLELIVKDHNGNPLPIVVGTAATGTEGMIEIGVDASRVMHADVVVKTEELVILKLWLIEGRDG